MPTGIYQRTEEHKRNLSKNHRNYQSEDTKNKISIANKGKKHTEETKRKIVNTRRKNGSFIAWNKGLTKETDKRVKINGINTGKTLKGRKITNLETLKRMSDCKKGSKSYLWKGGVTKFNNSLRNLFENKMWRSKVFERDGWTCQTCGKRGKCLEAHHIKRFTDILKRFDIKTIEEALNCKELWDINNGVTLCKDCHNLTKWKIIKDLGNKNKY